MLIEGLEGADEDAAVLQDAPHAVVDVLQHLAALSHRHGCGSPCSPPPPPLAAQTPPALPEALLLHTATSARPHAGLRRRPRPFRRVMDAFPPPAGAALPG